MYVCDVCGSATSAATATDGNICVYFAFCLLCSSHVCRFAAFALAAQCALKELPNCFDVFLAYRQFFFRRWESHAARPTNFFSSSPFLFFVWCAKIALSYHWQSIAETRSHRNE